jgi:hypothetical protein
MKDNGIDVLSSCIEKYDFNPFMKGLPDSRLRRFHRRHVAYFHGCRLVVDLGAGKGLFLEELRTSGIHGMGIESHGTSVEEGRAKGLEYFTADIFSFFDSSEGRKIAAEADGIYSSFLLEHLEPQEIFALFDAIKKYCAAGVRVRMITHNPADLGVLGDVFWGDLTHKRLYPGYLLEAIAQNRGFTQTRSEAFLGLRLGVRNTLRLIRDRLLFAGHKGKPNLLIDCQ